MQKQQKFQLLLRLINVIYLHLIHSKVKNELLQYELIAEELSGDTLFAEVSATTKKNLDKLKRKYYSSN